MADKATPQKNISYKTKEVGAEQIPKGATILKKSINVNVEEIENGFLVSKNYDIKYILGKETNYCYYTTKTYYKEDPFLPLPANKELANIFE